MAKARFGEVTEKMAEFTIFLAECGDVGVVCRDKQVRVVQGAVNRSYAVPRNAWNAIFPSQITAIHYPDGHTVTREAWEAAQWAAAAMAAEDAEDAKMEQANKPRAAGLTLPPNWYDQCREVAQAPPFPVRTGEWWCCSLNLNHPMLMSLEVTGPASENSYPVRYADGLVGQVQADCLPRGRVRIPPPPEKCEAGWEPDGICDKGDGKPFFAFAPRESDGLSLVHEGGSLVRHDHTIYHFLRWAAKKVETPAVPKVPSRVDTWWVNKGDPTAWRHITEPPAKNGCHPCVCNFDLRWETHEVHFADGTYLRILPQPAKPKGKRFREVREPVKGEQFVTFDGSDVWERTIRCAPDDHPIFGRRRWIVEDEPAQPEPVSREEFEKVKTNRDKAHGQIGALHLKVEKLTRTQELMRQRVVEVTKQRDEALELRDALHGRLDRAADILAGKES